MAVHMPPPHTSTGEHVVELHVHGGVAVIADVLGALGHVEELRPAKEGEFTRRAYSHGKLTTSQVEALGDLLHSTTPQQRRMALRQMHNDGLAQEICSRWRALLLSCAAQIEAYIDFSEDENIEPDILRVVTRDLQALLDELRLHVDRASGMSSLYEGVSVCIVGQPNVGKSSLINRLLGTSRALVSPIAGTTRDTLDARVTLKGHRLTIVDTAGLRETDDQLEGMGIMKSKETLSQSDLAIVVIDAAQSPSSVDWETWLCAKLRSTLGMTDSSSFDNVVVVLNKADMVDTSDVPSVVQLDGCQVPVVTTSCTTGEGISSAIESIGNRVDRLIGVDEVDDDSSYVFVQQRQLSQLQSAVSLIESAIASLTSAESQLPICAHYIRQSMMNVEGILQPVGQEDILDTLFQKFCIGK